MVDFEPRRWRNLGKVTDVGKYPRRTLYILHENGYVLNVYDTAAGVLTGIGSAISDESQLVKQLFDKYQELQEIHIYDKQHLQRFNIQVQKSVYFDLHGDEYRDFVRKLFRNYKGLNVYIREEQPKKDFYDEMVSFVENQLPEQSIVFIGIFKDNHLFFEMVWRFDGGKADLITTLDGLHQYKLEDITMSKIDNLTQVLKEHFKLPVYSVFMDYQVYGGLFDEWDRQAFIMKAVTQQKVKYRSTDDINPDIVPVFVPGFIDIFRRLTYNI